MLGVCDTGYLGYRIVDVGQPFETSSENKYLSKSGTLGSNADFWETREAAETFLTNWRQKNMNQTEIKSKLEQARKDRESIEANIKALELQLKQTNVPLDVWVGHIYKIPGLVELGMITSDTCGKLVLTLLSRDTGCYSSTFQTCPLSLAEMREALVKRGATYLGKFSNLFSKNC